MNKNKTDELYKTWSSEYERFGLFIKEHEELESKRRKIEAEIRGCLCRMNRISIGLGENFSLARATDTSSGGSK